MTIYVATHSGQFQTGVAYAGTDEAAADASIAYYGGFVTEWIDGVKGKTRFGGR